MKRLTWINLLSTLLMLIIFSQCGQDQNSLPETKRLLKLNLQTRDKDHQILKKEQQIQAEKSAIVIVDAWDSHWCLTWTNHGAATVPRLEKTLEYARQLGFQIIWCPSDVVNQYVGSLPRERALAIPLVDSVPRIREIRADFSFPYTEHAGVECNCGPGIKCLYYYRHNGMNPNLTVRDEDYLVRGTKEMYSVCKEEGITNLIYTGWATNVCLWGKPSGIWAMYGAGIQAFLARDLTDAISNYVPSKQFTPDDGTTISIEAIEQAGIPSVNLFEDLKIAGQYKDEEHFDMVRMSPWGKKGRAYFFEDKVTIMMRVPNQENAVIRYTMDGSEPDQDALVYTGTVVIDETSEIKVAAFKNGQLVSLISEAFYVKHHPSPPKPDIFLDQLETIPDNFYPGFKWEPKKNRSFEGEELAYRDEIYSRGMGFRAPGHLRYQIKPEWKYFVATGVVDTRMIKKASADADENYGIFKAIYPSVKFMIFIDGIRVMDSPVISMGQEWRMNVKIPENSRIINVVVHDAGSRNVLDLANLLDAGFCFQ